MILVSNGTRALMEHASATAADAARSLMKFLASPAAIPPIGKSFKTY
jgi:hypothetical protein